MVSRKRNRVRRKIESVFNTCENEKVWHVKFCDGPERYIRYSTIIKRKMLTTKTTYAVRCLGPKVRFSPNDVLRCVFWHGFKRPTFEPLDFEYKFPFSNVHVNSPSRNIQHDSLHDLCSDFHSPASKLDSLVSNFDSV